MAKIKNLQLIVVVAIMMIIGIVTACDKKNNNSSSGSSINVIEASNIIIETGSDSYIDSVKIGEYDDFEVFKTFASSPYQNHGFKLSLPALLTNKYLETINANEFDIKVTISDKTAKLYPLDFIRAWNNNNTQYSIGSFRYKEKINGSYTEAMWIYVNKDLNIQGSEQVTNVNENYKVTYTQSINLVLKKGWNIIYNNESENETYNSATETYTIAYQDTYSSQKPSNANLKWYGNIYSVENSYTKGIPKDKIKLRFGKIFSTKKHF